MCLKHYPLMRLQRCFSTPWTNRGWIGYAETFARPPLHLATRSDEIRLLEYHATKLGWKVHEPERHIVFIFSAILAFNS